MVIQVRVELCAALSERTSRISNRGMKMIGRAAGGDAYLTYLVER
jgi:hypothetical protein